MPDVHFWYSSSLFQDVPEHEVKKRLQEIVALHMDCFDDKCNWIKHDPATQIDVLTFAPIDSGSSKDIVMQVVAYDWPDRMRNMKDRLTNIGSGVAELFPAERGEIAVSFVPLPVDCWVKV